MTTYPAPVPEGTSVIVQIVNGAATRWVDLSNPDVGTGDTAPPRVAAVD